MCQKSVSKTRIFPRKIDRVHFDALEEIEYRVESCCFTDSSASGLHRKNFTIDFSKKEKKKNISVKNSYSTVISRLIRFSLHPYIISGSNSMNNVVGLDLESLG